MEKCYTISDVWLEFLHHFNKGEEIIYVDVSDLTTRPDRIIPLIQQRADNFISPYSVEWDCYLKSVKFSPVV